jgi:hypothetical protein
MSLDHSPVQQGDAKPVYTVAEFCSAHRISRSKLYQLWQAGEGPRVIVVGTRKLISTEAAAAWRATREAEYEKVDQVQVSTPRALMAAVTPVAAD